MATSNSVATPLEARIQYSHYQSDALILAK
jgi:hypothetical protein